MKLVANWRDVLRHATSIRLMLLAAVLSGLDAAQPLWVNFVPLPPIYLAALAAVISACAFVFRLVAQSHLSGDQK